MLKDLRKALNLSINELSELIDVSSRTIRRWEEGSIPTPRAVLLLLVYWYNHGYNREDTALPGEVEIWADRLLVIDKTPE